MDNAKRHADPSPPRRFDAVIFDMDGTLIEPLLDFPAIREALGITPGQPILESIAAMPSAEQRKRCHQRLLEWEMSVASQAQVMPGAVELLTAVQTAGLRTALLTRNAQQAMELVLARFGWRFDIAWSREAGVLKPQPDGVLRACREMSVLPARVACVGDFHYDILAANAAGAISILLATREVPPFAREARYVITSLGQLPEILGI